MEKGDFIKVSNREKDKSSTRPQLANNETNTPAVDESELCFRYVLDRGQQKDKDNNQTSYGMHFSPRKNTSKLPVSFIKMKM